MQRLTLPALALALALPTAGVAQDASTVVATVGGTDITLGHMIALRERLPQQYQSLPDDTLYQGILEQLIQQQALGSGAEELSQTGELIVENERRALLANEVVQGLAADAVGEDEIEAAYSEQYGGEPATEYNASHILVETEERAAELIAELEDGADFAELARANSTGPSGSSGGELGWFGPGAMVAEFDEAVQGMEVGEVAGPIQTQFGWHVITLNDMRQQSAPPLDEVRGEIEGQLQSEAIEQIVSERMDAVEIERPETEIDPALIRDSALIE